MFGKLFKIFSPMQWVEFGVIIIVLFSVFNFSNVVLDGIKEKFGMETKASLKEQTIKQDAVIKKVVEANVTLEDTLKKKEESAKVNQMAVVDKFKADVKVEDTIKNTVVKKDKVISEIKHKYAQQPLTDDNQKLMEKEISNQQISSLWVIYCSEAAESEQCKKDNLS